MSRGDIAVSPTSKWGRLVLLCVAVCALMLPFTQGASATEVGPEEVFCNWYRAARWGQTGDRCTASRYMQIYVINGVGADHSACVDGLDHSNNLIQTWVCSSGPGATASMYRPDQPCMRGIVRNNTAGDTNRLWGIDGSGYNC